MFLTSILLGALAWDVLDFDSSSFLSVKETSSSTGAFEAEGWERSDSLGSSVIGFSGSWCTKNYIEYQAILFVNH